MTKNVDKTFIIETLVIFFLSLIFSMIYKDLYMDEIWNYGFAHNIANGLVPYRDFYMVTTPLFPMLESLFFKIISMNIVTHFLICSAIMTMIYWYIKKINSISYYISFTILLFQAVTTYNILCLLFLLILLSLEEKHKSDYLIGFILGLTFLTKQSIGLLLCFPSLFTKDITKIIKRVVGFITPNLILLIYLIINNAFYDFIDNCFLGISEFSENNRLIFTHYLILLLVCIIYLIYKYLKTKDIKLIYLICFFGIAYPITDSYHVLIPFIPTLTYFLKDIKLNKKGISIAFTSMVLLITIYNWHLYTSYYEYPNQTNTFTYTKLRKDTVANLNTITTYIKNSDKETYIIDDYGYLFKLELSLPLGKYDYFLLGNLGKNGNKQIIDYFDKTCRQESCTFIVNQKDYNSKEYTQYNKYIHEYIINNYEYIEDIQNLSVYRNH